MSAFVGVAAWLAGSQFPLPLDNRSFQYFYAPIGAMAGFAIGDLVARRLVQTAWWRVALLIVGVLALALFVGNWYEHKHAHTATPGFWDYVLLTGLFVFLFVCFFFVARMAGIPIDRSTVNQLAD